MSRGDHGVGRLIGRTEECQCRYSSRPRSLGCGGRVSGGEPGNRIIPHILAYIFLSLAIAMPSTAAASSERECLAKAVYYEARGEQQQGMLAVALTTINRARWLKKTVCFTVHRRCDYSWRCVKKKRMINRKSAEWIESLEVATLVLTGKIADFTGGATHFHAWWVDPPWRSKMQHLINIGGHSFYATK